MTKIIIDTYADTKLEAKVKKMLEKEHIEYKFHKLENSYKNELNPISQKRDVIKIMKKFEKAMKKW